MYERTNVYKKKKFPFSGVEEEVERGKNMFCHDEEITELFPEVNKIANFVV
jgi:hypothetical protein